MTAFLKMEHVKGTALYKIKNRTNEVYDELA